MVHALVLQSNSAESRELQGLLEQSDIRVQVAGSFEQAIESAVNHTPDLILADLNCSDNDDGQLIDALHRLHPRVPIVALTAEVLGDATARALQSGALSFVRKGRMKRDVPVTVQQVLRTFHALQGQRRLLNCLTRRELEYRLDNDSALVPALIAECELDFEQRSLFDEPTQRRMLICLQEAVDNAIFHGNLEVSSALRDAGELGAYHRLAEERRRQLPYANRHVTVIIRLLFDRAEFIVRDEGPGFKPELVADPTRGENIGKVSGRGLFLMRAFMDEVGYNASGNEVRMCKLVNSPLS